MKILVRFSLRRKDYHSKDPKVNCQEVWSKCDIIETFHTNELVKCVISLVVWKFYLIFIFWIWTSPQVVLISLARKRQAQCGWSLDGGGLRVWDDWESSGSIRPAAVSVRQEPDCKGLWYLDTYLEPLLLKVCLTGSSPWGWLDSPGQNHKKVSTSLSHIAVWEALL